MRPPTLTYKMPFLTGGVGFGISSYFVGTWLYSVELYARGSAPGSADPWILLSEIAETHPSPSSHGSPGSHWSP